MLHIGTYVSIISRLHVFFFPDAKSFAACLLDKQHRYIMCYVMQGVAHITCSCLKAFNGNESI